jgi:phosphoethanolamine N-methyltransferase
MTLAGFICVQTVSRNLWYRDQARVELARLQGADGQAASKIVGAAFVAHNAAVWSRMIPVLDTGEHCPTHLRAQKPL